MEEAEGERACGQGREQFTAQLEQTCIERKRGRDEFQLEKQGMDKRQCTNGSRLDSLGVGRSRMHRECAQESDGTNKEEAGKDRTGDRNEEEGQGGRNPA